MAMNIISKEKKEIRWIGLPTNSAQECQNLEVMVFVILGCAYNLAMFYIISNKDYGLILLNFLVHVINVDVMALQFNEAMFMLKWF